MAIYKNKDIATDIKVSGVEIGHIGAKYYTEDENTASITVHIKYNSSAFDLTQTEMRPKLDLFTTDGSIFLDEPVEVVDATQGTIKYTIQQDVIKHVGSVNAKLFLWSETESVHVANFQFDIGDSGVDKAIAKSIDVNLVDDAIMAIINANPERFRGEQGYTGDSAYQSAVAGGFKGTESEWLLSLNGKSPTAKVVDNGDKTHTLTVNNTDGTVTTTIIKDGAKGDKGATGEKGDKGEDLHIDGVVDSVDKLPNGTTASNYIVGEDLYFRVAGQSTWQKGLTLKNKLTIGSDGYFYLDGVKSTAVANESQAINYSKLYVQSRGENLVTNGTGLMGDNTNFSNMTFKTDEVKVGGGSFYSNKLNNITPIDEFIPVDTAKRYQLSAWAKTKSFNGVQHAGFASYDIDKKDIFYDHFEPDSQPMVTLTQPLKIGDTKVYVSDVTQWLDTTGAWNVTTNPYRGIILWGYKSDTGMKYEDHTYSRYSQRGIASIDQSTNTITLSSPWNVRYKDSSDGSFPIGHKLNRMRGQQSYAYALYSSIKIPTTWTNYSTVIGGNVSSNPTATDFRQGTAFIKPIFLTNYSNADETWINGIDLREATDDKPIWLDAPLLNGFTGNVKYYKDKNNLVTIKFDVTAGSTVAGGTYISTIPSAFISTDSFIPIPATNVTNGVPDLYFNIGSNTSAFRVAKPLVTGHRLTGQITYRVG